jgi:hypothetical protein
VHRLWPLAPAALLAVGAAAPAPEQGSKRAQQCFWPSEVSGFSDAGPDRALVRIGTREIWELTLSPGCPDVNWAMRIGIQPRGGQRVCIGRPAELIVPDAGGAGRRCLVRQVRKLSRAEAESAADAPSRR